MPDGLDSAACAQARREIDARNIEVASLSATYNMIHPDPAARAQGMSRLGVLASHAAELGTDLLTLCTGTRNPTNMWQHHPQNNAPEAWADLLDAMEQALTLAEKHDVRLGIEPEVANVVNSPQKARKLLDTMGSDRLTIVMDGANVFPKGTIQRQQQILDEAFDLLGGCRHDSSLAQRRQRPEPRRRSRPRSRLAPGLLDYDYYLHLFIQRRYRGASCSTQSDPCTTSRYCCGDSCRQKLQDIA